MKTFHKILPAIPFALARVVAVAFVLTLAGCATLPSALGGGQQASADRYNAGQVQQVQAVQLGTVVSVRTITIHQTPGTTEGDSLIGAAVGGLLGHQVGQGTGKLVATAALAVGGAVAGNKLGDAVGAAPRTRRWCKWRRWRGITSQELCNCAGGDVPVPANPNRCDRQSAGNKTRVDCPSVACPPNSAQAVVQGLNRTVKELDGR